MKRRNLLATFGALTGASGLGLGTGAFTSVSAERSVTVEIADDFRAFLRLEPVGDKGLDGKNTGRSFINGRRVKFEFPGDEDGENQNAEGVGTDSVYEFYNLLEIVNQGTQKVQIASKYDGSNLADLSLIHEGDILRDSPPTLAVGQHVVVGIRIDTDGSAVGEYNETLTIVGSVAD